MVFIDVLGTEVFANNWSNPSSKLDSIKNYIDNVWANYIEDGSGDYVASVYSWSGVDVPESALPSNADDLDDRRDAISNWLDDNWSYYSSSDIIVAVDYYNDGQSIGTSLSQGAGVDGYKTVVADAWWEDNNSLPTEYESQGTEGVSGHEIVHPFGAKHPDDVTTTWEWGSDHISLMYSHDGVNCSNNGATDTVWDFYSNCTENEVQSMIDERDL